MQTLGIIKPMSQIMKNQQKMEEEGGGDGDEREEMTLRKELEMADKLKMYCFRKGLPDVHPKSQVSEITDKILPPKTSSSQ